ncbi:MAG: hypothetical protein K8R88_08175 [Armatimonadetes bacterium]|nr:hypothetical protein [Armatimonadota bacterium]
MSSRKDIWLALLEEVGCISGDHIVPPANEHDVIDMRFDAGDTGILTLRHHRADQVTFDANFVRHSKGDSHLTVHYYPWDDLKCIGLRKVD